jgi:hypothetical protein
MLRPYKSKERVSGWASLGTPGSSLQALGRERSGAGGAHLGNPLVELARQVRHDAQLPLDQH